LAKRRKNPIFLTHKRASPVDRVCAKGVDFLVAAAFFSLVNLVSYPLAILVCLVFALGVDGFGPSVGKRIFGLRVLQDDNDLPATKLQSVLRNVPFGLGILFGAIPVFWVFFALLFVPLFAAEVFFLFRLDSSSRLGDVLAETYISNAQRQPGPLTP
jgi:uncharacterized RDD family membrane protein YckC